MHIRKSSIERLQHSLIIIGFFLLLISNVVLVILVSKKNTTTILLPTISQRLIVSESYVSEDYLKLRAKEVHFILFGMNQNNAQKMKNLLLQNIDNVNRQNAINQLDLYINDIQDKHYYYNFSDIIEYSMDANDYKVKISGYLETFISEEKVSREYKSYLYEFVNRGGLVLLRSFKEANYNE